VLTAGLAVPELSARIWGVWVRRTQAWRRAPVWPGDRERPARRRAWRDPAAQRRRRTFMPSPHWLRRACTTTRLPV